MESVSQLHYLVKRALTYLIVFVVVLNLIFILPRLVPGNAAEILASSTYVPANAVKEISARLGLDQPIGLQYTTYLKNIFLVWPPYFGVSFSYYPSTVSDLFGVRIGWTLLLILTSIGLAELWTYFLGAILALRRGGKFEIGSLYTMITLNSLPLFWLSMVLIYAFAIYSHYFPLSGNFDQNVAPGLPYFYSVIWHAVLPVFVLSVSLMGESFLLLRGSMQDILKSDFVLTARSRGLSNWEVSSGYILRNSLLPLISQASFSMAGMISRVILVEFVFGYPGVGDLIVDAVLGRDYPVLEGSLFYVTLLIIAGGLIGDFLLMKMDPRLHD